MTKKEFRKKCKAEKTRNYKFMVAGGVFATIGLLVVLATFVFLNSSEVEMQLLAFGAGAFLAFVGMILDIVGEAGMSVEYKSQAKK